jgi:hypothetical protein
MSRLWQKKPLINTSCSPQEASHRGVLARWLVEIAWGVDQSVSLVRELLGELRRRRILMPSMAELERLVAACRHRARQRAYESVDLPT